MKKIINILALIYILLLYYIVDSNMKLLITFNFGIFILVYSSLNTIKGRELLPLIKKILIYGIPLTGVSYLIGYILHIKYLPITNTLCSIFIIISIIINNINRKNIYYIPLLLINIIILLITSSNYNIIYLYITSLLLFIIIFILEIKHKKKETNSVTIDKEKSFINIISSSYIYISLIILYFMLNNKYINPDTNIILSNTFFFGLIFIYIIYRVITKYLNIDYNDITKYNQIINKILNISLHICILLLIISYPLSKVIFNTSYNILFNEIIILFTYLIYNTILKISINKISNKKINISILLGLLVKVIFEIPLINSAYRMGYDLSLGVVLSSSLGLIISSIIITIFIIRKYKINILNNFTNILNIIYTNIIYILILILLTLLVKVDSSNYLLNILIIIFYIFISFIFFIIKKRIIKSS